VASKYLEQWSGIWVVAAITRAVDDKAAQTLMSKTFRRQLMFDGMYSNVTMICSRADDISITEVRKAMPEDSETHQLQAQLQDLREQHKKLRSESKGIDRKHRRVSKILDQLGEEIDELQRSIDECSGDEVVPASPMKRPAVRAQTSRKRQRPNTDGSSESSESDTESDDAAGSNQEENEEQQRVSRTDAASRLKELKDQKKSAKAEKRNLDLDKERRRLRQAVKESEKRINELAWMVKSAWIMCRNDQSRPAIQSQYAKGLRE
jgi:chromosome segregation ATPase